MGVSVQRHTSAALCRGERTPSTHCAGGWVGRRASLDSEVRGKILCPCQGSNPDHPVVQSIVRHYTDWGTPAPEDKQHIFTDIRKYMYRQTVCSVAVKTGNRYSVVFLTNFWTTALLEWNETRSVQNVELKFLLCCPCATWSWKKALGTHSPSTYSKQIFRTKA
jgi:hypothetical protein